MNVTIDRAGRLVIPKGVRERWALKGGETLVLEERGDRIELRRPPTDDELVEINGLLTFRTPGGPATVDETLAAIDKTREPRF